MTHTYEVRNKRMVRKERRETSVAGFFRNWGTELGGMQKDIKLEAKKLRLDKKENQRKQEAFDHNFPSSRSVSSDDDSPREAKVLKPVNPGPGADAYLREWHKHDVAYRKFQEQEKATVLVFDDIP